MGIKVVVVIAEVPEKMAKNKMAQNGKKITARAIFNFCPGAQNFRPEITSHGGNNVSEHAGDAVSLPKKRG